jgi:hypothetical protein
MTLNLIGFDKKFVLLAQEAHLAKNTLLSGFDLLLKANFFQDRDGYFYSAFFSISIGLERLLKLGVVTHYMLSNGYKTPTIKQLKKDFGHDIRALYEDCLGLVPIYQPLKSGPPAREVDDAALIDFLTEYSVSSRYFNLNEICEAKFDRPPLEKWRELASCIYEQYTPSQIRQKAGMALMYRMDRQGSRNGFTMNLTADGHPMSVFDCLRRQYVIEKSAPLVIWRLIEMLRPIHFLLAAMSLKASEYEAAAGLKSMVIPHYEDFFYFLLAEKSDIKRRKTWLALFNR